MNQISLLNWMVLSTVLLGVWWACYRLALRQERSFAYNRVFLVLGPLLAAGLPLLPLAWPAGWWGTGSAGLPGLVAVLLPTATVGPGALPAAPAGFDWAFWLGAGYVVGGALLLLRLAAELGRLWWSARELPRFPHANYTLLQTHGRLPTSSFGRLVFWDETLFLSSAEARQVLRHELAHVRQGHTYDRLLLELLRAALWFNPFVHLCGRALALTHEYLADEAALHDNSSPIPSLSTSYSQLLARQVVSRLGFSVPLAHSFSHSQTLRRIAMIQKTSPVRRWKQWLALPLLSALLFTVGYLQSPVALAQNTPPATAQTLGTPPPPPPPPKYMVDQTPNTPEKVYTYVEKMPQLPGGGGNKSIVEAIQRNVIYPPTALANRKEGRVFVSFYVDSEGHVKEVGLTQKG
jgi:Zn-dependent protease with chaperone function